MATKTADIITLRQRGTRFCVYAADGRPLGIWDNSSQAEAFLHPGWGRFVGEIPPSEPPPRRGSVLD